jgi:hypothetical protein
MKTVHINTKTDRDGHLRLDMPLAHSVMDISVIVVMDDNSSPKNKYNCSDLVGKLKWQGDAVKEQRSLREEWK